MKALTLMLSMTFTFAAFADARPLTVGAPDGSGNVTITIGGTGTQNQTLIAAWANGDKGNDPLDWTEYADAGTVAPSDTSKTFQIPAAWRAKSGAVRFFLMSGEKPYGQRFDYITRPTGCNDGGLYIDTGIVPDSTLDITVKVSCNMENGNTCAFGSHRGVNIFSTGSSTNSYYFYFFGASNKRTSTMQLYPEDHNVFGDPPPKVNYAQHTFRLCRDGVFINGYRHTGPFDESSLTNIPNNSIYLFDRNGSWKSQGAVSIYSAKIAVNGGLVGDFVPAITPVSKKVSMWNRVTGEWHHAKGSQANEVVFAAGNDIGPYPPDCGSVETVSPVINIGPSISAGSPDFSENTIAVTLSSGHDAGILFAVAGTNSESAAFSEWTTNAVVQKVAADVDEVTFALPSEWVRNKYNVRFAWKSMAGKPYDYEVESVGSDATTVSRIRTGKVPTTNTTMSVVAKAGYDTAFFGLSASFCMLTGDREGTAQSGYSVKIYHVFFRNPSDSSKSCNGSTTISNASDFLASYHEYRLGPGGVYIDDARTTDLTGLYAADPNATAGIVFPFRAKARNDDTYAEKTGDISIRSVKIWEGDEIMYDCVPCVKNGVPGFYNKVKGTFNLGKATSAEKPFSAGAPVVADGDIISWSKVRSLRNGLAIFVR